MKKRINVKPVTELELIFEDGKSLTLKFDVEALTHFNDFEDGMQGFLKDKSTPEICAKIVYIGGSSHNDNLDINEARKIVSNMDPATITEIIYEFNESMGVTQNEAQKELSKKLMAQFLNQMK